MLYVQQNNKSTKKLRKALYKGEILSKDDSSACFLQTHISSTNIAFRYVCTYEYLHRPLLAGHSRYRGFTCYSFIHCCTPCMCCIDHVMFKDCYGAIEYIGSECTSVMTLIMFRLYNCEFSGQLGNEAISCQIYLATLFVILFIYRLFVILFIYSFNCNLHFKQEWRAAITV